MKFVNLTPHKVVVIGENGNREFPSEGVLRVTTKSISVGEIDGIPLVKNVFENKFQLGGETFTQSQLTKKLADKDVDVVVIVSLPVLQALSTSEFYIDGRWVIFVAPDTSPESVVRDEEGRIVGVKRFMVFHRNVD